MNWTEDKWVGWWEEEGEVEEEVAMMQRRVSTCRDRWILIRDKRIGPRYYVFSRANVTAVILLCYRYHGWYAQYHVRARSYVQRWIGVLKGRWRCLRKEIALHYVPEVADIIDIIQTLYRGCGRVNVTNAIKHFSSPHQNVVIDNGNFTNKSLIHIFKILDQVTSFIINFYLWLTCLTILI